MSRANITHQSEEQGLAALADRIRAEHKATQTAMRTAVAHALNAGDALTQAKAAVSGNWLRWLRSNCSLSVRTAQLYMRLAQHRTEIEEKISGQPDLSVRSAQRLISRPKVAAAGKRTTTGAPASASIDIATVRLGETVSRLLWQALGQLALGEQSKAIASLRGVLNKLQTKRLEFHDIAVVIQRQASARPRARSRAA
jgi:Protein of unknown function (DUF3102)